MFKLFKYLKGYTLYSIIAPLFKIIEALFELIIPLVVAKIIDVGIANSDTTYIMKLSGLMILLGICGLSFAFVCQYLAAKAAFGYGTNLRRTMYNKINGFSFAEIDKYGASGLVTRLTNDITQTQTAVSMIIRLILRAPVITIGSIIMAMMINVQISIVFICISVVITSSLLFIMHITKKYYTKIQKELDHVSLLTRENLSGNRVVRAFSRETEEEDDFKQATEKLTKTNIRAGRISALLNPLTTVLINLAIILVLWFGGFQVDAGNMKSGDIFALVNYLNQILIALVVVVNFIITLTRASASAKRINEILNVKSSIVYESNDNFEFDTNSNDAISFDNVSFVFDSGSGKSLDTINLNIKQGETLGIIGSTGSGKSTLINLICRFYDATEGEIKILGTSIKKIPKKHLAEKIGLVPQSAVLFTGTIRDNMLWGNKNATDEIIWRALKSAQAEEFVKALPDQLDTKVVRGGKNFSGGQKQRLTIARALVSNPKILILDDSSSALDFATDARLRAALKQNTNLMTVVMISQRATTLTSADQILVLEEGKPVGLGTHSHLLNTCDIYAEIYNSQAKDSKKSSTTLPISVQEVKNAKN